MVDYLFVLMFALIGTVSWLLAVVVFIAARTNP